MRGYKSSNTNKEKNINHLLTFNKDLNLQTIWKANEFKS